MRRIRGSVIIFSLILLLVGCQMPFSSHTTTFAERESAAFDHWTIPGTFIPKRIYVVGLGDSLTQGVGDERKKDGYFGRITERITHWKGVKDVQADNLAKRGRRSDQLLKQLEDAEVQAHIENADLIFFTIGGNDLMKIVKRDLFKLKKAAFYEELEHYAERLGELFGTIRALNSDAVIIAAGIYNPFSIVMEETTEFEDIIDDWNEEIEFHTVVDDKSCFIPVKDLFDTNANMVYHTDFFHPNAKGYEEMTNRFLEKIAQCGLFEMSDGQLDM